MPALIRINSVVQLHTGKLQVSATLPDGRTVEGEIAVSLDRESIARAVAQLPADRPMPHLTGQVTLEDDEYNDLRALALADQEAARRAVSDPLAVPDPLETPPEPASAHAPAVTRSSRGK